MEQTKRKRLLSNRLIAFVLSFAILPCNPQGGAETESYKDGPMVKMQINPKYTDFWETVRLHIPTANKSIA